MSKFDRENFYYRSLPISNQSSRATVQTESHNKPVNFSASTQQNQEKQEPLLSETMVKSVIQIPVTNISSSSASSVASSSSNNGKAPINPEEFAKLDALLEDLLAEVDQPIMQTSKSTKTISDNENLERSIDWLNHQKERLRSRRETANMHNKLANKYNFIHQSEQNDPMNEAETTTTTTTINYTINNDFDEEDQQQHQQNQKPHINKHTQCIIINNKPPASPSCRTIYSPNNISQAHNGSFRSLSVNPSNLRNINELEDESANANESEFDRFSQRSFRSTTSTVQRTKYHTVSNDYIECTRPTAPTPVPTASTYSLNSKASSKRALSAPPTEVGKVLLQRMELKSPLTVRQGSTVPFEHPPLNAPEQLSQQQRRVQTPLIFHTLQNDATKSNNVLSSSSTVGRGILKQNYNTLNGQPRNAFLNRSYTETPKVAYTNGYETDSGYSYNRYNNTGVNSYRTIGPSTTRYLSNNHQNGYETDTGLINLRQVLDLNRHQQQQQQQQRAPSRNNMTPLNYRCYTPNVQIPIQQESNLVYPSDETMIQPQINTIQYIDAQGNVKTNLPAFVSTDGNQIIIQEIDPNLIATSEPSFVDYNLTSTLDRHGVIQQQQQQQQQQFQEPNESIIIQQQVAPSAYQSNGTSSAFQSASTSNLGRSHSQLNRLASTTSQTNLSPKGSSSFANKDDVRRSSATNLNDTNEVYRNHPKSVKTTQNFWYKPKISRDEAINLLKDKPPGTFLIRDSNNFPGAYGLALKVDKPPANVQIKPGSDPSNELVRHFLIEPTTKGVRIKGCCNEPVFGSLAALVYQHSITPLALPIKLVLPTQDLMANGSNTNNNSNNNNFESVKAGKQTFQSGLSPEGRLLLEKGAACNVYYLNSINIDNKVGLEGINYALTNTKAFVNKDASQLLLIQFKVTSQGITVTDLQRKKFLKKLFPTESVTYCAVDEKLTWPHRLDKIAKPRIFGVICKSANGQAECHLFVEMDPEQPAIAIVDFINRYLIPSKISLKNPSN